jgi:hypothetical protein
MKRPATIIKIFRTAITITLILLVSAASYTPFIYVPYVPAPNKPIQLKQVRIANLARADTGGPTGAGTDAAGATACTDNMVWSGTGGNPSALQSNDTTYVSYSAGNWDSTDPTDELRASNFGFTTSGTITGIQVEVIAWTPAGSGVWRDVILFTTGGTPVGNDKSDGSALGTTDPVNTYKSFGGSNDTWNASLTSAQVNASTFGVSLCWTATAANSTINVDQVRITITYTPAVAPTVTTDTAESYTADTAKLFGSITALGSATPSTRGFAYSTNSTLSSSVSTTSETGSFGTTSFSGIIGGLTASQTYFYRAFASSTAGDGYGVIRSFTTGNTTATRKMRLFEGFRIKLIDGRLNLMQN